MCVCVCVCVCVHVCVCVKGGCVRGQLSRRGRSMATIFVAGGAVGRNCSGNVPELFRRDMYERSTVPFQECVSRNGVT